MEKLKHPLGPYHIFGEGRFDIYTAPHSCSDSTCPGDINWRKLELFDRYKKILEGLTPSGSEYVNDPERCEAVIRRRLAGPITVLKRQTAKLEVAGKMAEMLKYIHREFSPFHSAFYDNCPICGILSSWDKAGKGTDET